MIMVSFLTYHSDVYFQKNYPKFHNRVNFGIAGKKWFNTYRFFSVLLTFVILLILYGVKAGEKRANTIKSEMPLNIELIFNDRSEKRLKGSKIGANVDYVFLLDQQENVQIIPLSSNVENIILLDKK